MFDSGLDSDMDIPESSTPWDRRVIGVAPADGWFAIYEVEDKSLWIEPVACWVALSTEEADDNRGVIGLRATRGAPLDAPDGNLIEYRHRWEIAARLRELLKQGYSRHPYCYVDWNAIGIKV
jgi:hypothetical protein